LSFAFAFAAFVFLAIAPSLPTLGGCRLTGLPRLRGVRPGPMRTRASRLKSEAPRRLCVAPTPDNGKLLSRLAGNREECIT
jgi:hypothetical protein